MPDGLLRLLTRQGFVRLEAFPTSLGEVPDGLSITGVMRKEEGWFRTPHRSGSIAPARLSTLHEHSPSSLFGRSSR